MGGVVDHSSNLPDPVALSSAEVEYNEGCLSMMATSHLQMLLAELENIPEISLAPINTISTLIARVLLPWGIALRKPNTPATFLVAIIMFVKESSPNVS